MDSDLTCAGSSLAAMQAQGPDRFRNVLRHVALAAFFVAWFLMIWWTEGVLTDWIRVPLTVLWLLAVVGAVGMTLESLVARRRGRNTDSSS